jgi:cytochrome c peroxidase
MIMPSLGLRLTAAVALVVGVLVVGCGDDAPAPLGPDVGLRSSVNGNGTSVDLGRYVFFDKRLSIHGNQACAACHSPEYGFTGPIPGVNVRAGVYPGSFRDRSGNRRPPAAAYAAQSPILKLVGSSWFGGNFWDGRATGEVLGNPAADQALGPFLNPVEQALPDAACVVWLVREGSYISTYESVWGDDLSQILFPQTIRKSCRTEASEIVLSEVDRAEVTQAYHNIALSVSHYEASPEVSAFSSKYDAYLRGQAELTDEEGAGLVLFQARCEFCHTSRGTDPLFTTYSYSNIGTPRNPLNPVYGEDPGFVDLGLGGFLVDPSFWGAQKIPTVRNVAKAPGGSPKSFMHNGVFKTLEQVVHFYNTRAVLPECTWEASTPADLRTLGEDCWPAPEVTQNVNQFLGNFGWTTEEEANVVAFLRTLNDGW